MSFHRSGRVAVAFLTFAFAVVPVSAQKPKSDQDPSEKPRNVKPN